MAALRRTLRAHSWIPLLAFLWGSVLPFSEAHALGQDDNCVVVGTTPNGAATTVSSAPAERGEPTHCVICHLMRAMGGVVQPDAAIIAAPFVAVAHHARLSDAIPTATLSSISSRGPPSTL